MENGDRRQCLRTSARGGFTFTRKGASNEDARNGQLVDCSVAGIRFVTDAYLEKNTPLLIELDLDQFAEDAGNWRSFWQTADAEILTVVGSVMWCQERQDSSEGYEVGTRFIGKE